MFGALRQRGGIDLDHRADQHDLPVGMRRGDAVQQLAGRGARRCTPKKPRRGCGIARLVGGLGGRLRGAWRSGPRRRCSGSRCTSGAVALGAVQARAAGEDDVGVAQQRRLAREQRRRARRGTPRARPCSRRPRARAPAPSPAGAPSGCRATPRGGGPRASRAAARACEAAHIRRRRRRSRPPVGRRAASVRRTGSPTSPGRPRERRPAPRRTARAGGAQGATGGGAAAGRPSPNAGASTRRSEALPRSGVLLHPTPFAIHVPIVAPSPCRSFAPRPPGSSAL